MSLHLLDRFAIDRWTLIPQRLTSAMASWSTVLPSWPRDLTHLPIAVDRQPHTFDFVANVFDGC
jgi:hypothetical protein